MLERIIEMFKYVDDTTTVEAILPGQGVRHISAQRPSEQVPAPLTSSFLTELVRKALEIGMRVNCKKTQMLCLSPDNGYDTWAAVDVGGERINCQDKMKLLGFMLGTSPGVTAHEQLLQQKFRARFWSLIHLRRAGIHGDQLFRLYAALIRPVLEVNCVVFHPMLMVTQREVLERMQKQVCRLCFGSTLSYSRVRAAHNLDTLHDRRVNAIRKFITRTISNCPRFADRWFVPRRDIDMDIRRRRPYVEKKAKTERYLNSPLLHLQRVANDIQTGG